MDHANGGEAGARAHRRLLLKRASDAPCFGMGCPYHDCDRYRAVEEAPGCSTERATCFDGASFRDYVPEPPPALKVAVRAIALVLTRPMPPIDWAAFSRVADGRADAPAVCEVGALFGGRAA